MRIENAINDAVDYFMENPSNAFASGLPSQTDVRLVLNDLVGEEGYGRASQSASVKKVMARLKKLSKNLLMENPRRIKSFRISYGTGPAMTVKAYTIQEAERIFHKKAKANRRKLGMNTKRKTSRVRKNKMRTRNSMGQKLYVVITADGTPLSGRIGTLEPPGPIFYTKGEAIKKARMFRGRVVSVESYYKMSRGLRRNEQFARQIPRRDRPMRGRGFDKRFDVSAGSDYNDLYKILTDGNRGVRKLGDNTWLYFFSDKKEIVVKLYQTPILTYYPNGDVDVNFGGYMTTTTFSRINNLVPYGWNLRKKAGKLALENSWGQRAIVRKPRAGEEYAVRLTPDKAYIID